MRILQKNLLKSVSRFTNRSSLQLSKRDHICKTTATAAVENKHTLLLRRLSWSGVDEDKIFSEVSHRYLSHTKLCLPTSTSIDSPELPYFCGAATSYYSALSPHNFSPIETPEFPHFNNYEFRGSCGGVICLDNDEEDALFWNPTTNQVKFLPKCQVEDRPDPKEIQPLNVLTTVSAAGFGFDSESGDYKYIRWILLQFERLDYCGIWNHEDTQWFAEMCSLKKDSSWERIHCPYDFMGTNREETACFNGHAYWIAHTYCPKFTLYLLCFNFSTEKFSAFPLPNSKKGIRDSHWCRLFEYGGRLGLVLHPNKVTEKRKEEDEWSFEIWALNEQGRWSKEFDGCIEGVAAPLGFSEDGGVLFLVGEDRFLYAFDMGTNKLKKLDIYCNPQRFDLIRFEESRVQLNCV